jgi:hypothetical protein
MFHAKTSKARNLLHVRYSGQVCPADTQGYATDLPPLLSRLQPGFRMLTDLSGVEEIDLACVPHIKGMMDLCNKRGVEMIVRVIPDPTKDVGMNIMSLFHYRKRVRIVTCETLAEAMKLLR